LLTLIGETSKKLKRSSSRNLEVKLPRAPGAGDECAGVASISFTIKSDQGEQGGPGKKSLGRRGEWSQKKNLLRHLKKSGNDWEGNCLPRGPKKQRFYNSSGGRCG